ncbi:MAG TPA: hypothetical protein VJH23_02090 [archaeon]|nr:hypothetical protein [archaeon]
MDEKTQRAIRQMPREIRRQTKVIATIGEALIDTKIKNLKRSKEDAKYIFEKIKEKKK